MQIKIIGIDCSTQSKKVGLARGRWDGSRAILEEVRRPQASAAEEVAAWILAAPETTFLLALDAPLGWPLAMACQLPCHRAGEPVGTEEDSEFFFTRETDRFVKKKTGKRPLEVGANLIARTGRWALCFLHCLCKRTGEEIPLAWNPAKLQRVSAIEVYPAATYLSCDVTLGSYGKNHDARQKMGEEIKRELDLVDHFNKVISSPHLLDAAACVLAGADFLARRAYEPGDKEEVARKEGWIWFRENPELRMRCEEARQRGRRATSRC